MLISNHCAAQLTINIRYSGAGGAAKNYVKEMEESGFFPADDPEGLLLIDEWADAEALNRYHSSPMMQEAAALREKYGLGGRKVTMFNPVGGATWPKGEPNGAAAAGTRNGANRPFRLRSGPSSKFLRASSTGTAQPPTAGCSILPCTRMCRKVPPTNGWNPCPTSSTARCNKMRHSGVGPHSSR